MRFHRLLRKLSFLKDQERIRKWNSPNTNSEFSRKLPIFPKEAVTHENLGQIKEEMKRERELMRWNQT